MKIGMRGTNHEGEEFTVVRDFEYSFEIVSILEELGQQSDYLEIKFSDDVDIIEAEVVMAAALGALWKDGVCKSPAGTMTRLTSAGGRA